MWDNIRFFLRANFTKILFSLISITILVALYKGLQWYFFELEEKDKNSTSINTTSLAIYASAIVALVGWLITASIARINSVKQHTFNILLQGRLSNVFRCYKKKLISSYPSHPNRTIIPNTDIEKLQQGTLESNKVEAIEALQYFLDYYEFIAAGIRHNDLDKALMKSCQRAIVCEVYEKGRNYIKYVREEDDFGNAKYPKYYEHLIKLYSKWKEKNRLKSSETKVISPVQLAHRYLITLFSMQDIDSLADILDDDLHFQGPLYTFTSAHDYIESLKTSPPKDCTYEILHTFEKDDTINLIYRFSKPAVTTIMSQFFEIKNGKIAKILLIFDTKDLHQNQSD